MNSHLFVYGTLLSAAAHPNGARLRREARLVGAASIAGRLYRIGRYPGLIEAQGDEPRVHGEVYALNAPAASLTWLDAYESIVPGSAAAGEYARVERPVRLAAGGEMTVWVYLYQRDVAGRALIADGRWASAKAGPE